MKSRRAVAAALAAALASSGLVLAASTAPAGAAGVGGVSAAPAQLLHASLEAAQGEAGVDWVGTSHSSAGSVTLTTKAGRHDGLQSINFRVGSQTGQISIILVGTMVYLRGNVFGLEQYLGFSNSAAKNEAGRWFSISEPDASLVTIYETVAAGLTVSTTVAELGMTGPITQTAAKSVAGQHAIGIRGTTLPDSAVPSTPQTLYVKSTGEHLPVEALQTYERQTSSEVLGDWGQAPSVHAPSRAVPLQLSWLATR